MKFVTILIIALMFYTCMYSQKIDKTYILSYELVAKSLKDSIIKSYSKNTRLCNDSKEIVFVCPTVTFVNLALYKDSFGNYIDSIGIGKNELNSISLYRDKYSFQPYIDSSLVHFSKPNYYHYYLSFSKLTGRVLPVSVFYNDDFENKNPCSQLFEPKFGDSFKFFIIFNENLDKINHVIIDKVAMN